MKLFEPTYLYIKRHKVTGLLYFGKTSKQDPYKYKGSGKYWCRHINKYGAKNVETLWVYKFHDKDELVDFAIFFSSFHEIVLSKSWANLAEENGLSGGMTGKKPPEFGEKISATHWAKGLPKEINPNTGSKRSKETCANISIARKDKPNGHVGLKRSEETCKKLSETKKGKYYRDEAKLKEIAEKHKNIILLYESKPDLIYGSVQRNGRLLSYERAFCKNFHKQFDVSDIGMMNIIMRKVNIEKYI